MTRPSMLSVMKRMMLGGIGASGCGWWYEVGFTPYGVGVGVG